MEVAVLLSNPLGFAFDRAVHGAVRTFVTGLLNLYVCIAAANTVHSMERKDRKSNPDQLLFYEEERREE